MYWTDIMCWCVGRGEATITIFDDYRIAQIIDFGSNPPLRHEAHIAISNAKYILNRCVVVDAVITHFHYDHYSLIPLILGSKSIRAIYIPPIPRPKPIMKMVSYLMALQSELMLKSGQTTLSEIAKRAKRVYFAYRGVNVMLNSRDLHMRILWPPLELPPHIAEKVIAKLEPVYEKAKRIVEKAGIKGKVQRRAEKLYEAIDMTLEKIRKKYKTNEGVEPIEVDKEISSNLPTIIKETMYKEPYLSREELDLLARFRNAVNDLSLILKHYHHNIPLTLIPGDNSNLTLDFLSKLEQAKPRVHRYVTFMRGAHHGTYFGRYLKEHKAFVTWLSWTSSLNKPPHFNYFKTSLLTFIAEQVERLHVHINYPFLGPRLIEAQINGLHFPLDRAKGDIVLKIDLW